MESNINGLIQHLHVGEKLSIKQLHHLGKDSLSESYGKKVVDSSNTSSSLKIGASQSGSVADLKPCYSCRKFRTALK